MNLLARTSSLEAEPSPGASADAPPSRSLSFETIPNPAIEVSELPGGLLARTRRGNVLEWSSVRVLGQERLRLPFSGEPLRIHWSIDTIQVLANATPPPAREPSEGFPGTGGWRVHLGVRASRSDYVRANRLQEALWITLLFEDSSRGLRVSGLLRQVNQHKRPGSLSKDSGGLEIVHSFGPMPCESGRPYVVELELDQRGARMRYPEPDRGLRATEFRTWGEGRARLAGAFAAGVHLFAEVGGWRNGRGGSRIIARVPELPAESLEPPASAPAPRPSPPSEQEPRPRQPRQPEPRGDRPPPPPPPQRPPDRRGPPPGGRLPPR